MCVVRIRRQLLRNKRNRFACRPNMKMNSCMEMNVLDSHRSVFKFARAKITAFLYIKKYSPA